MGHVPHVLVPGPWEGDRILLTDGTDRHLGRVLRASSGMPLSYTDGAGSVGDGVYEPGALVRGAERHVPRPQPDIVVAVAPPRSSDRVRFLVEKAAELAVTEIVWLHTRRGEGRPPRTDKAQAWADGALEQSRGAWRTVVARRDARTLADLATLDDPAPLGDRDTARPGDHLVVAQQGGVAPHSVAARVGTERVTIAVGPEGGFAEEEVPAHAVRIGLGDRTLRVETAVIVAVAAFRVT